MTEIHFRAAWQFHANKNGSKVLRNSSITALKQVIFDQPDDPLMIGMKLHLSAVRSWTVFQGSELVKISG